MPDLQDTALNGRYRITALLGRGGMATVYRATDLRLGRVVAVKVLHPHFADDRTFLTRFQREARLAASLSSHPNIVAIHDVGADGALHYIVMELVPGPTLKDRIRREAPLEPSEVVQVGRQVASALAYAHSRGVVHRDVKPQNILLGPDRVVKVTDFGIAVAGAASGLTVPGTVIGSAQYMAPEQATGRPATPASDVYALGVVLYEMATARLPFTADTPLATMVQQTGAPIPSPSESNPSLPSALASIVMQALAKDPGERFAGAGALDAALHAFEIGGAPAEVRARAETTQAAPLTAGSLPEGSAGPKSSHRGKRPIPLLGSATLLLAGLVAVGELAGHGGRPRSTAVRRTTPSPVIAPQLVAVPHTATPTALPPSLTPTALPSSSTPSPVPTATLPSPTPSPNALLPPASQPPLPPSGPAQAPPGPGKGKKRGQLVHGPPPGQVGKPGHHDHGDRGDRGNGGD